MVKRWGIWLITASAWPCWCGAVDVVAEPPTNLAVTVYRAPERAVGAMDLNELGGFALVRETRTIRIPAGESRVRFEGVADGIEPASALIEGLPRGLVEKNRDAQLLSPSSLVAATVGKSMVLVRSNLKSGKTERVPGKILADAEGVVFQTEAGIEALRCSGPSETFSFSSRAGLSSTPTLSILVRTPVPITKVVTLSYLASGFDWTANYTATLSADGSKMDLGAWVTLANGNGVGFPAAHTQVVAGRVNVENHEVEPIDFGGPVVAQCWPQGTTSSSPETLYLAGARPLGFEDRRMFRREVMLNAPMATAAIQEVMVTGQRRVIQEQLGDLKLYRVPQRTTVASRQSKQVRLLDKSAIPVRRVYVLDLGEEVARDVQTGVPTPAHVLLRTKNNAANNLGLPLPSGVVAVFGVQSGPGGPLLLRESGIGDTATDEEVEIEAGTSYDVQITALVEETDIDPATVKRIPLVPGISLREVEVEEVGRVEVSNARAADVQLELRLPELEGMRLVRADHPVSRKNGRSEFRLTVPAHKTVTVRFQTGRERVTPIREE